MQNLHNDVFVGFAKTYTAAALEIEGNKITGATALQSMAEWLVANGYTGKLLASGTDARKELKEALRSGLPDSVRNKLDDASIPGDIVVINRKGKGFTKRETIQRVDGTYTTRVVKYVEKLLAPTKDTTDRDRTIEDLSRILRRLQGESPTGFGSSQIPKLIEKLIEMGRILN